MQLMQAAGLVLWLPWLRELPGQAQFNLWASCHKCVSRPWSVASWCCTGADVTAMAFVTTGPLHFHGTTNALSQ